MNKFYNILQNLENYLKFQKTLGMKEIIDLSKETTASLQNKKIKDNENNLPFLFLSKENEKELPNQGTKETLMKNLRDEIGDCKRCKLHTGRTNLVFGTGNVNSELVFVGEAPGADEDIQGEPFVGRAGELLTKIIKAMGYDRKEIYIANIIKCRPPNNRNPEPDEIKTCEPFLRKQLSIISPKIICTLGTFATQTLLKTQERISLLRGKFYLYQGIKVMPTFHPAFLLRNPQEKRTVWEDVKLVMKELGRKFN